MTQALRSVHRPFNASNHIRHIAPALAIEHSDRHDGRTLCDAVRCARRGTSAVRPVRIAEPGADL